MTAPAPERRRSAVRVALVAALVLALVVQVVVLYAPQQPGEPPFAEADKLVHLGVFLVPTALALLAGLPPRLVLGLLAAHAVVSEVVQGTLLPDRSGDPFDVLADLVGVALGALVLRRAWSGAPRRRW